MSISSEHRCIRCEGLALEEVGTDETQLCVLNGVFYCSKHFQEEWSKQ